MIEYQSCSNDELMEILGEKINEFTIIYFESDDVKAIRRLKNTIRELKEEINSRLLRERKKQAPLRLEDLGLYRSHYRNTTV